MMRSVVAIVVVLLAASPIGATPPKLNLPAPLTATAGRPRSIAVKPPALSAAQLDAFRKQIAATYGPSKTMSAASSTAIHLSPGNFTVGSPASSAPGGALGVVFNPHRIGFTAEDAISMTKDTLIEFDFWNLAANTSYMVDCSFRDESSTPGLQVLFTAGAPAQTNPMVMMGGHALSGFRTGPNPQLVNFELRLTASTTSFEVALFSCDVAPMP
jgi:hypothetical protein